MSLKVGIISQARLGSTRLPGKVLKKINSETLLDYHLKGLSKAGLPVVIATTDRASDDPIVEFCQERKIPFFRGSESDVLSRYYHAALENHFDIVVRVTSDCPLVDGTLITKAIAESKILEKKDLYVSNALKRTFPRGYDFEIFSFDMLKNAFMNARLEHEREHVTPYVYKKALEEGRSYDIVNERDFSEYRLTVDTVEDFTLIDILIREFHANELSREEVFKVLEQNPQLKKINAEIQQKPII